MKKDNEPSGIEIIIGVFAFAACVVGFVFAVHIVWRDLIQANPCTQTVKFCQGHNFATCMNDTTAACKAGEKKQ